MIQKGLLTEMLVILLLAMPESTWTFTTKPVVFGIVTRQHQHHQLGPIVAQERRGLFTPLPTILSARKPVASSDDEDYGEEDDDNAEWEPDDADLSEFDDLDLDLNDVDDDDIDDDEIVATADDEDDDEEDEDEFDEDDLELDEWEDVDEDYEDEDEEYADVEEEEKESDISIEAEAEVIDEEDEEDEEEEEEDYLYEYELEDDPEDPDYQAQKEAILAALARRDAMRADDNFDAFEYIANQLSDKEIEILDSDPVNQEVEAKFEAMGADKLQEKDFAILDLESELRSYDIDDYEPYEKVGDDNVFGNGISDDDLAELDKSWKELSEMEKEELENPKFAPAFTRNFQNFSDYNATAYETGRFSNETREEWNQIFDEDFDEDEEADDKPYDYTPWLDYDLDFNVTNLILAAVKHNRKAPLILHHWLPQLQTMERYQNVRDRDFDFTLDDVENADIEELERYYAGFGYDEIPTKLPGETGIINMEELDEDEIKMAAFDTWMKEVYNPAWDRIDLDDEDLLDEDNVYSDFFEMPQHPDLPTYDEAKGDLEDWKEELGDELTPEDEKYRDMVGREVVYDVKHQIEKREELRGHLVVACTPMDSDLEIAEKITARMNKEFGEAVFVETRVIGHAREEDSVFEVWLESYEIDLLHSKKRASSNTADWDGPADCDDAQIDYLVERVGFLTSDEARYSYRMIDPEIPV